MIGKEFWGGSEKPNDKRKVVHTKLRERTGRHTMTHSTRASM